MHVSLNALYCIFFFTFRDLLKVKIEDFGMKDLRHRHNLMQHQRDQAKRPLTGQCDDVLATFKAQRQDAKTAKKKKVVRAKYPIALLTAKTTGESRRQHPAVKKKVRFADDVDKN